MPVQKISDMTAITGSNTATDDLFLVVDSSTNATKKITRAELNNAIEQDVLASIDITTANIDGGTIDGTTIGASSATTGVFTTVTANTSIIPDASGGADIGSATKEWGDVYIADDKKIKLGSDQDVSLEYDEDGTNTLLITGAVTFADGTTDVDVASHDGSNGLKLGGTLVTSSAAELNILDGKSFVDEDNMSSNSATGIPSQQSVKAYVDAQFTASDLDFQGDSGGALSIDLDSETLDIAGGTGIDTSGSSNTLTVAIDSTVATLTGSQTLTNKTITTPTISAPTLSGSSSSAGSILFKEDTDNGTNSVTLIGPASTADVTVTLPNSAGTLALTSQLPTSGISSGNVATFTSGAVDDDFLRIDGTSIEGRSASEVLSDIGGQASLTFGISNTNAVKIDSSSVANGEFAKFTANGLESRSTAELSSDIGAATTDDIIALSIALG